MILIAQHLRLYDLALFIFALRVSAQLMVSHGIVITSRQYHFSGIRLAENQRNSHFASHIVECFLRPMQYMAFSYSAELHVDVRSACF